MEPLCPESIVLIRTIAVEANFASAGLCSGVEI
jgi:hypothetical protein